MNNFSFIELNKEKTDRFRVLNYNFNTVVFLHCHCAYFFVGLSNHKWITYSSFLVQGWLDTVLLKSMLHVWASSCLRFPHCMYLGQHLTSLRERMRQCVSMVFFFHHQNRITLPIFSFKVSIGKRNCLARGFEIETRIEMKKEKHYQKNFESRQFHVEIQWN